MKTLLWFMTFIAAPMSCLALEMKESMSSTQLFDEADEVAVIRLTGGDYVRGIGDGYQLRGEVLTPLKGNPPKNIAYNDGYDYGEPCFARTLGAYYLVFLKNRNVLWATGASIEVNGGSRFWFGEDGTETEISDYIKSEYGQTAYFGNEHVWYMKECNSSERYNRLMMSIIERAFNKSMQPTESAPL